VAVFVEIDFAIGESEQCPISARADVLAGDEFGAALADENTAGGDELTAESLHAQPFANAVASIADTALTLPMCQKIVTGN
jgi:hypothetical protein